MDGEVASECGVLECARNGARSDGWLGRVSGCDGMWLWLWLCALKSALRIGQYQSYAADRGFVPSSAELPTYFDSKPNGRNAVSGRSRCLCCAGGAGGVVFPG